MLSFVLRALPPPLRSWVRSMRNRYFHDFSRKSYAQEGEDILLDRLFDGKTCGFYVDVGAHHPQRFSNTYLLYRRGWRGINIDAMPGSMAEFDRVRRRDINLEVPISSQATVLTYYVFDEPALNGFDAELSKLRDAGTKYRVLDTISLRTKTLSSVLDQHLAPTQEIDLLSIDVEGLDEKVLRSNDWHKYRPKVVLIEVLGASIESLLSSSIHGFLTARGYELYAKTMNSAIFRTTPALAPSPARDLDEQPG